MRVESPDNPRLRHLRRLARDRRLRHREGLTLVEGVQLAREALAAGVEVELAVLAPEMLGEEEARGLAAGLPADRVVEVRRSLFLALSELESPQGVALVVRMPPPWDGRGGRGDRPLLVVDRLQDPGNLGTLLRAAEAMGGRAAVLLRGTVDVWSPKVVRGSMGAVFRLPLRWDVAEEALLEELAAGGWRLLAALPRGGRPLWESRLEGRVAVVVGNEAEGVSPRIRLRAEAVTIPMEAGESLNAAVAGAMILYEAARQRAAVQQKAML
ncbi:MAG: RNA methyltransferase [Bacillota bacterium]|nr:RNA methyltransferase [Bacillota bacterium]